jgi:hypothetical protein
MTKCKITGWAMAHSEHLVAPPLHGMATFFELFRPLDPALHCPTIIEIEAWLLSPSW